MMHRPRERQDETDELTGGAAQALHVLGWMFTIAALLLLYIALEPSVFDPIRLADQPVYDGGVHRRYFVAGLVALAIGVMQYLASIIVMLRERPDRR